MRTSKRAQDEHPPERTRPLAYGLIRLLSAVAVRCVYRLRAHGVEHAPLHGAALLVSNHVTWIDPLLIACLVGRPIRFVVGRDLYARRWLGPLFRLMGSIPVSPRDPPRKVLASLRQARKVLQRGELVCVFPEGNMTRNGNLRPFRAGLKPLLRGVGCPIVPVYIAGGWGTAFSHCPGPQLGRLSSGTPRRMDVLFGEPMPTGSSQRAVRRAILELSRASFELRRSARRILPWAIVRSARRNWRCLAAADATGKRLGFGGLLAYSAALTREMGARSEGQDVIGILLPTSLAAAAVNVAVLLLGKVSVNLNFTASRDALRSAVEQAGIQTIISSRVFLEKMETLRAPEGTLLIEDIVAAITPGRRIAAWMVSRFLPGVLLRRCRGVGPDDAATIVFSSGSTGEPKGVVLSHHNLLSNVEAFLMVMGFRRDDRMCSVLPFFHAFGYTCTLLCPLLSGFASFYHTNPLDAGTVTAMVKRERLTILLATPTFLLSYARRAEREDFTSLRLVVAGAEKLRRSVADAFEQRFGLRPLEGYGTTELSPVAAVNVADVDAGGMRHVGTKEGSIGHPIPGVVMEVVDPVSGMPCPVEDEGLLRVRGPNVMRGYLKNEARTAEAIRDGWYETGDVARMDSDGFVFVMDRAARYSKVAGEMVPHLAVEDRLLEGIGTLDRVVAVTSVSDEKRGEQLVVLYTEAAGDAETLHRLVRDSDLPNLWKPRRENYVRVDAIPWLGSGKLDLKRVREIARLFVENRPGPVDRFVERIREAL